MAKNLIIKHLPAVRVSPKDGGHYFFGYFDKPHWDGKQQRLLAHRAKFTGRQVRFSDVAEVGILENQNSINWGKRSPGAGNRAPCYNGSMTTTSSTMPLKTSIMLQEYSI